MLSQQELADRAGVSLFTVQRIERGDGSVRPKTGRAIAAALGVGVEALGPIAQATLPLESVTLPERSLEELHAAAGLDTDWLIKNEREWRAAWPLHLTPREAMQNVRELATEFHILKPLIVAQEEGLPIYMKAMSGQYKQAWRRFFDGLQAAHACAVANGVITPAETLNDLAGKLGEEPGEPLEELLAS
jgi:transcriptional regulator with XRE-family HTH domain